MWELKDSPDSNGGTLNKVLYSGEGELVESIFSGGAGHQVEGWGCCPTVKISDLELFLRKETAETNMEKSMKERRSSSRAKLGSSSRGGLGS